MELKDVRVGNYVKEHEFSSRPRALEPFYKVEYNDLGYHNFMVGIPINLNWCKLLNMDYEEVMPNATSVNYDWLAEVAGLRVRGFKDGITVFHSTGGSTAILDHIKYVHQLQNFFYGYWGFEIDEENPTEFYKEPKNE